MAFLGPPTVMDLPYIKKAMAAVVYADCGTVVLDEVVACFGACGTAKEVKAKVRRCCRNPSAGETIIRPDGTSYTVPTINERAACSLLDALIERDAFNPKITPTVVAMRAQMRGGGR